MPGVVVYVHNPNYMGDAGRRMKVRPTQKSETLTY
jgi:hypothetical protein